MNAITELNLSYLLLAQRMIRESEAEAMLRLGVSQKFARLIARLTPTHLIRISSSNMLLCGFRFDDPVLLGHLASDTSQHDLGHMQLAILFASQRPESIN